MCCAFAAATRRGWRGQIDHLTIDDMHLALRAHRQLRIVRHHHDGGAVAMQLLEQIQDAARHLRIEIAGGFIRQQQPRRPRQRARDRHALLLPAREFRRIVPGARRQAHAAQRFLDAAAPFGGIESPIAQRHIDVVLHVQVGESD